MSKGLFFAVLITLTEAGAAVCYFLDGDWRRGVIWTSYMLATIAITV